MSRHDEPRIYFSTERSRGRTRYRVTVREGRERTSQTFSDKREAQAVYQAAVRSSQGRSALTVGDVIDMWIDDQPHLQPQTIRNYRQLVEGLCDTDERIVAVDPELALQWYLAYQPGHSVATHQQALQMTKQCFRWAAEDGIIRRSPFARVVPHGKRGRGKRQLRLSEAQTFVATCLADLHDSSTAALCGLLLGMRPGEVLAMTARDIDDDGRLVWIPDGKTENADRVLTAPDVLAARLAKLGGDRVFPYQHNWLRYHVTRLCELAGVPRVTPHGLRGTHSSLARTRGATSHVVAAALGHGNDAVTRRHYIDASAGAQADADRVVVQLLGDE